MWDPRAHLTSFMQTWNLNIQYELGKNWMIDLAYVGNKGNNLESGMVNPKQLHPIVSGAGRPAVEDPLTIRRWWRSDSSRPFPAL